MNMVPQELLAAAKEGVIRYELLRELARNAEVSPSALLDGLAALVAMDYSSETMTFNEADIIMNAAFGVSLEFLVKNDLTIPPSMFEVYCAFDAGEYYHHGDPPDVDPEVKYTKPLIAKFLATHGDERRRGAYDVDVRRPRAGWITACWRRRTRHR